MKVFATIAVISILLLMYSYFNTSTLALGLYPSINQPDQVVGVYNPKREPFIDSTVLDFPWT